MDFRVVLRKGSFLRKVATVGGGLALAQGFSFLCIPVLTRLYSAADFGVSAAYTVLLGMSLPLAGFGYGSAIVLPKSESDVAALARLTLLIGMGGGILLLLLLQFNGGLIFNLLGLEMPFAALYLAPVAVLIVTPVSLLNQIAIRNGEFYKKSKAYVIGIFGSNFLKIFGGIAGFGGVFLVVSVVVGFVINLVCQVCFFKYWGSIFRHHVGLADLKRVAIVYKAFPLYGMPQGIIRAASVGLPVLILTTLFGSDVAGQYSLAYLVMAAPVVLLGDAVGEVFYPRIAKAVSEHTKHTKEIILKMCLFMGVGALLSLGWVMFFGAFLFSVVFGEEWYKAGEYAGWMVPWMVLMLAARPAVVAMPALGLQRFLLSYEVIIIFLRLIAMWVGSNFSYNNDGISILLYSVVSALGYLVLAGSVLLSAAKKVR